MSDRVTIHPLSEKTAEYLRRYRLEPKFRKALDLLGQDMNHPSLNVEILKPKHLRVYSFRIDKKYRALFIRKGNVIDIFKITNHYD